ncbi:MAG: PEP-CTERM sorting domain-containing protein, partial [Planctomycetes bacterium]|nr:PEP-CTERM sorting domain-containing protein [Planctomycetota bacterium]
HGRYPVQLPTEFCEWTIDLLTPINLAGEVDFTDENFGMVLDFGFGDPGDPVTKWGSAVDSPDIQDTITYAPDGGPLTFRIPEPGTLSLLGLGGLALIRRRAA